MMRPAYTTAVGVEAASGTRELNLDLFDSVADDSDKADEAMALSNRIRDTKEQLAKRGNRR